MQNLEQSLEYAMAMTRQMLELAKQDEWQQVADLESQRHESMLAGLQLQSTIDAHSSDGIRIQAIIDLDREIQQLVSQARETIRDELLQINKGRTAAKAYNTSE